MKKVPLEKVFGPPKTNPQKKTTLNTVECITRLEATPFSYPIKYPSIILKSSIEKPG